MLPPLAIVYACILCAGVSQVQSDDGPKITSMTTLSYISDIAECYLQSLHCDCQSDNDLPVCMNGGVVVQDSSANPYFRPAEANEKGWAFSASTVAQSTNWRFYTSDTDPMFASIHPPLCAEVSFGSFGSTGSDNGGTVWVVLMLHYDPKPGDAFLAISSSGGCTYTYGIGTIETLPKAGGPWYFFTNIDDGSASYIPIDNAVPLELLARSYGCGATQDDDTSLLVSSVAVQLVSNHEGSILVPDVTIQYAGYTAGQSPRNCFAAFEFSSRNSTSKFVWPSSSVQNLRGV